MNELQNISVTVMDTYSREQDVTENLRALLTEISSMLTMLINDGNSSSIDLHSLPLLPGEHETIKTILGEGEVAATLHALGSTTIYETVLSGVWWITHDNENGERIAETIEITRMPEILKSQPMDIEAAETALQQQLQEWAELT